MDAPQEHQPHWMMQERIITLTVERDAALSESTRHRERAERLEKELAAIVDACDCRKAIVEGRWIMFLRNGNIVSERADKAYAEGCEWCVPLRAALAAEPKQHPEGSGAEGSNDGV